MRPRSSLRALCGVLLLTLLAVQPVTAAPSADESGREWFDTLGVWWGQLVDRFGAGRALERPAALPQESGGDAGPGVAPLGGSAPVEGEGGPEIDPAGGSAVAEGEGEGGPAIDPAG